MIGQKLGGHANNNKRHIVFLKDPCMKLKRKQDVLF